MTRPPDLHVLPVGARGDHRPLMTCPCNPTQATEIMGGPLGRVVYVHRDPEPRGLLASQLASGRKPVPVLRGIPEARP